MKDVEGKIKSGNRFYGFFSGLKTNRSRTRMVAASLFVLIFAAIGSYVFMYGRATGVATITMAASNSSIPEGGTVVITISENSNTIAVNSVDASFSYDTNKLTFVGIENTFGVSTNRIDGPIFESNGHVTIAVGSKTALTGNQQVAKITFRAKSGNLSNIGTAAFRFDSSSAVVSYNPSTETSNDELPSFGQTSNGRTNTSVTVTDATPPTAPTGITKDSNTNNTITFHWTASTDNVGVTGYRVYRGTTQVGTPTSTSFTDTGLVINNSYVYKVQARDAVGNWSTLPTQGTTLALSDSVTPSTPTNLTVQTKTSTYVSLSWSASTDDVGVTGYKIYRGGSLISSSPSTSFTNTGLAPATSYSYKVSALDAAGNESSQSTAVNVTTSDQPGDTNGDKCTDIQDLGAVITNWNKTGMTKAQGNLIDTANDTAAQIVNIYDFNLVIINYGKGLCPQS